MIFGSKSCYSLPFCIAILNPSRVKKSGRSVELLLKAHSGGLQQGDDTAVYDTELLTAAIPTEIVGTSAGSKECEGKLWPLIGRLG